MMIRPRTLCLVVVTALAGAVPARGQTSATVSFDLPVQRTSATYVPAMTERKIAGAATVEHRFAAERARLFYDTALDRFSADGDWSTWLHNTGVIGTFTPGGTSIDVGGSVFWRVNGGGWSDAGFRGFTLASAMERAAGPATFSGGYNLYNRQFADAPALNQLEHYGHGRALVNFESRTTIVAAVATGWKQYEGHAGEAARTMTSWTARVAQSLTERTGAWGEYEQRRTSGDPVPAVVWTPPTFYDDGVYDDPYAIDATTWRAGAKHVFSNGATTSATWSRSLRDYTVPAVTGDGPAGTLRSDRLFRAALDVSVPVLSRTAFDLDMVAGYGYIDNRSTEILEQYRTHVFSAGLRAGF